MDVWHPMEGGLVNYSTNDSNVGNVVYIPTPEFPPFQEFRKIPRLFREVVVTEKIDGSNASITITEDGQIRAGSRTRYITPGKKTDNYGFAAWVEDHKTDLLLLGKGRHYGEWYGKGINRNYGLEEKRFALFNTGLDRSTLPSCVGVVPVLYTGPFDIDAIRHVMYLLREHGSVAVSGFLNPEGVVVYHKTSGQLFKATLEHDESPKGQVNA